MQYLQVRFTEVHILSDNFFSINSIYTLVCDIVCAMGLYFSIIIKNLIFVNFILQRSHNHFLASGKQIAGGHQNAFTLCKYHWTITSLLAWVGTTDPRRFKSACEGLCHWIYQQVACACYIDSGRISAPEIWRIQCKDK